MKTGYKFFKCILFLSLVSIVSILFNLTGGPLLRRIKESGVTFVRMITPRNYETYTYTVFKIFPNDTFLLNNSGSNSLFTVKDDFSHICCQPPVEDLLRPCQKQLAWKDRLQNSSHLRTKVDSSLVNLVIYRNTKNADQFSGRLQIQTFDRRGVKKSVGGDWWRVVIVGKSNLLRWSVRMVDLNNGSYTSVLFPIPLPGEYMLNLHLEHSLCEGILDPPKDWFRKGIVIFDISIVAITL